MKATLVYHTVRCCRFDCLVRSCTCKTAPVVVDYDGALEEFLEGAASQSGDTLADGRVVQALAYWEELAEGVLVEFTTLEPQPLEAES